MRFWALVLFSFFSLLGAIAQEQCGSQVGGAVCPGGLCCSQFGFCGSTPEYCTNGCQSQCSSGGSTPTPSTPTPTPSSGGDLSALISQTLFNDILKHRNDEACPGKGFYTYDAFVAAAKSFGGFATTGDTDTRKREIAAFLAQTSHATTGCLVSKCSVASSCNYNYGPAGVAIQSDLINNPDAVATDATISCKTALWFWMTPQSPKPSCHNVITGGWTQSDADRAAGRVPEHHQRRT
ncbi:hypothetical protein HHK36_010413 [Tetracentron sinense]|uniref:Chitin-binding type-1 domain-containing protein n=1 Tax=Tetracentron sinense TaxID=13715 RepID=A0A834ZEW5_TETSI|nr:hypothetical protein HHK36_010413 [Tetracentron sinense]